MSAYESLLPDWVPRQAWAGFEETRKKLRKPLTEYAVNLIVKRLNDFRAAGHDPGAVLDQSTEMGWQGVFELKDRRATERPGQRLSLPQLGKSAQATANNALDCLEGL